VLTSALSVVHSTYPKSQTLLINLVLMHYPLLLFVKIPQICALSGNNKQTKFYHHGIQPVIIVLRDRSLPE